MIDISIPTYNRALRLELALLSAASLPSDRFAIRVFDNGSTDDTLRIVKKFTPRVKYLRWNSNRGIYANWQRAILEIEDASWVIVLSDDDELVSETVLKLDKLVRTNPDWRHSVGIIVCNAVSAHGRRVGLDVRTDDLTGASMLMHSVMQGKAPLPSAVVFNKSALSAIGGFVKEFSDAAIDIPTYTRLMASGYQCVMLTDELCKYTAHDENFTKSVAASAIAKLYEGLRSDVVVFQTKQATMKRLEKRLDERLFRWQLKAMRDAGDSIFDRLSYLFSQANASFFLKLKIALAITINKLKNESKEK